jgi:hypothetical protein
MSAGKYISLEEVRRNPRLLGRFIRERINAGHGATSAERFEGTLDNMIRSSIPTSKTSSPARGEDCSETQIRKDTSEGASGKRERASRE